MIEIIPAILAETSEQFFDALKRLAPHAPRIHVDIIDGLFAPTKTINGYEEIAKADGETKFDVHLMVNNPIDQCRHWWPDSADRFWVQVEELPDPAKFVDLATTHGKRVGMSVNPETDLAVLEKTAALVNMVQFMTVHPGAQGRPFVPSVLGNIRKFRERHPDMTIAVDGGLTPQTVPGCAAAGASIFAVGSYILKSDMVPAAIESIMTAARSA